MDADDRDRLAWTADDRALRSRVPFDLSTTPLESKWVTHGWRSEARVVEGKLGRGVLATRSIIDTTTAAWALPAPLVALLLG